MQLFEIWQARVEWKGCSDARPWIVVDLKYADAPGCFPISSHHYQGWNGFPIEITHPYFLRTGLTKSCFILYDRIIEIKASSFLKKRGILEGDLLTEFRKAAGI